MNQKDIEFYKWLRIQLIVKIPSSPIIKVIDNALTERSSD